MLIYILFMLPPMILAVIAAIYTRRMFGKYSRVASASGITGAEAAARLMSAQGIRDVSIEQVRGYLSDHYDPMHRVLRLSPEVYGSASLSAIGVACHEAGHALQHASGYAPLGLRSALVPVTQFGSSGAYVFFLLGMLFQNPMFYQIGIVVFSLVVVFAVVTLPVEWNASSRAKALMVSSGIVSPSERDDAGRVLYAAFLTYIASAVTALMELLYHILRARGLGSRND